MSGEHILVVDDEPDLVELVLYNLRQDGFEATGVGSGEQALVAARTMTPDLILLDLMMPGLDGIETCRALRQSSLTRDIPIVMLTAKDDDADVVRGLEVGADDYVTKPFSPRVLLARIAAVLRRRSREVPDEAAAISVHGLEIHPGRHEVLLNGGELRLTPAEFRALHHLARRPGWVFTRQQIVEAVHGSDYVVTDRSVDVLFVGLRKKLGDVGHIVETVRGVGYRLKGL